MNSRTWAALALGVFLIAVALGLILYWAVEDIIATFAAILIVFGVYLAVSSFWRGGREDAFGPKDSDAVLAGGAVIVAVGVTCLVWIWSEEALITVAVLIILVAVIGIAMALKNRRTP